MAHDQIAPTKSNLLKTKEKLNSAMEGHDLLEQKREILVMELMHKIEEVKILERQLNRQVETAYPSLKRMLINVGRERAEKLSRNIHYDFHLSEKKTSIMGLGLLGLDIDFPKLELKYSPVNSFAECDETVIEFFKLLKIITELASVRTITWRLARELRKTQRRVNALDKMVIPAAKENIVYIDSVLEERERDTFFVNKLLKKKGIGGI